MTAADDFAEQLIVLRKRYAERLKQTLDALIVAVSGHKASIDQELIKELHAGLHKLAGSGGTFGFAELSQRTRALELTAKTWLDESRLPTEKEWEAWQTGFFALPRMIKQADVSEAPISNKPGAMAVKKQDERIRIVIIEDDVELGKTLAKGLTQFGYEVDFFCEYSRAEAAILEMPPDILIVDIMLSGQIPDQGTDAVAQLFSSLGFTLPTVFITSRLDFSARLAAAKAGGNAFLTKPLDIPTLAGCIDILQREREFEPFRVLIVDDDEVLAEHYRLTLTVAGMLAEKVCRPEQVLSVMQDLHPDILLIDLYMPDCTGAELARAIRYDDNTLGTPIIYLSAENDLDEQIKALECGGADDFLTKPISDTKLVAMVRTRAARARKVNELMSKDSLTGLLKHASIKDRIEQELERAHRHGKLMSMAMVDMDHFKRVNDTWGHPMGDQVIKTLAQLLRQRLRRQDSIGRYGGEEFAIVLPECNEENAVRLLDDVRKRFGEVRFHHRGESFTVTLSAGVAGSEQCADAQSLLTASDAALYVAKNNGRNQVRRYGDHAADTGI